MDSSHKFIIYDTRVQDAIVQRTVSKNIMIKSLFLVFTLFAAWGMLYAAGDAVKLKVSRKKWLDDKIIHYTVKVGYNTHSPMAGSWVLEVNKGHVIYYSFNGSSDGSYLKTAESFTMDSLYKRAGKSLNEKSSGAMKTTIEYDRNSGYIKSIRRVRNPSYRGGNMRDAGYIIDVVEFIPHK